MRHAVVRWCQRGALQLQQQQSVRKVNTSWASLFRREGVSVTRPSFLESRRLFSVAPEPPQYEQPEMPPNVSIEDESVLDPKEEKEAEFKYDIEKGPKEAPFLKLNAPEKKLEPAGSYSLCERVWSSPVRFDIIHKVVEWQRAKRRQGTKKVKTIAERSGTGKKPHPQKGTGRARQGTKRAPHMRKGGRVLGPDNPDYSYNLPKKVRRYGLRSTLSARLFEKQVFVVDTFTLPEGEHSDLGAQRWKTKDVEALFKDNDWTRVAFVDAYDYDVEFRNAVENFPSARFFPSRMANVYDLLKFKTLVLSESGLKELEERLDEVRQREKKFEKRRLL